MTIPAFANLCVKGEERCLLIHALVADGILLPSGMFNILPPLRETTLRDALRRCRRPAALVTDCGQGRTDSRSESGQRSCTQRALTRRVKIGLSRSESMDRWLRQLG